MNTLNKRLPGLLLEIKVLQDKTEECKVLEN